MDLAPLIEALSRPSAYPFPVAEVRVIQTHISVVFLAGPFAYKVKKPVKPGFLDFSTLDKRRHFCQEEVRLNRRLAPRVYLGVVPVVRGDGGLRLEGDGEAVEWAVKMQRLPPGVTLHERLRSGDVAPEVVEALARKVAEFHRQSPAPEDRRAYSRFEAVARNVREVFDDAAPQVGTTVSRAVFGQLRGLCEAALARLRPLIDARAERGLTRDAHGDLHLDHVCVFPDKSPPDDLVIIDCIEFSERFRFIDPVADVAFPVMDLAFHGRRDLARLFADAYFRAAGDEEGRALLPLYSAYRAAVRGAVEGMKLAESEVAEGDREEARRSSRGHWLLALGELEEPARRPGLVLVGGLPGTGKSTLAAALAERGGFGHVRSDAVRKALAGVPGGERLGPEGYTPARTAATYADCLRRAEARLFEGGRVLVDATFRHEGHRRLFLGAAAAWAVPVVWLVCRAEPGSVRARLEGRRGDVSDADWSVHLQAASAWEEPGPGTRQAMRVIATDGAPEEAVAEALAALREAGLVA
jgi:aminoglycoside phosphotransferase family enzyme/predicted kinase